MIEETMQSEMKPMLVKRASTIGKEYQEVIIGHNSMFKNEFQKSFERAISILKFQPNFCQASLPKQSKHTWRVLAHHLPFPRPTIFKRRKLCVQWTSHLCSVQSLIRWVSQGSLWKLRSHFVVFNAQKIHDAAGRSCRIELLSQIRSRFDFRRHDWML